jgi:hypothetical protein
MAYFGNEKKLLMSVSALYSSVNTQTIGITGVIVSIFNGVTPTQLASSIGYPTISVASGVFTLEAGYKYLIDARFKVSDSSPSAGEYISYYLADSGANQISSTGITNITTDSSAVLSQERCIAYIDASSGSTTFTVRMQKNSGASVTLNSNIDAGTTGFYSHLLIKAWK